VAGRQQQRHETQAMLWERAQRRDKLHQQPRLPAACSHLLLKDLAITNGHRPAYCIKGSPAKPAYTAPIHQWVNEM